MPWCLTSGGNEFLPQLNSMPPAANHWVSFEHGGQRYAIRARQIMGVLNRVEITPMRGAPEGVLGIVAVDDELVPVLETSRVLDRMGARGFGATLVLNCQGLPIGLPIEILSEPFDLAADEAGQLESASGLARFLSRKKIDEAICFLLDTNDIDLPCLI